MQTIDSKEQQSFIAEMKAQGLEFIESEPLTRTPLNPETGRFEPVLVKEPEQLLAEMHQKYNQMVSNKFPEKGAIVEIQLVSQDSGFIVALIFVKVIEKSEAEIDAG